MQLSEDRTYVLCWPSCLDIGKGITGSKKIHSETYSVGWVWLLPSGTDINFSVKLPTTYWHWGKQKLSSCWKHNLTEENRNYEEKNKWKIRSNLPALKKTTVKNVASSFPLYLLGLQGKTMRNGIQSAARLFCLRIRNRPFNYAYSGKIIWCHETWYAKTALTRRLLRTYFHDLKFTEEVV